MSREKPITVAELIEKLNGFPQDMRVMVPGYEAGLHDADVSQSTVLLNYYSDEDWFFGPHKDDPEEGDGVIQVVRIGRA